MNHSLLCVLLHSSVLLFSSQASSYPRTRAALWPQSPPCLASGTVSQLSHAVEPQPVSTTLSFLAVTSPGAPLPAPSSASTQPGSTNPIWGSLWQWMGHTASPGCCQQRPLSAMHRRAASIRWVEVVHFQRAEQGGVGMKPIDYAGFAMALSSHASQIFALEGFCWSHS